MDTGDIYFIVGELQKYGPLGLGLLSFISNLIPGFPAIYLSLLASYAIVSPGGYQSLLAILAAGVGSGLGKTCLFLVSGFLGSKLETVRARREALRMITGKRGGIAVTVFLFAALPLPDDILYIPLGVAGFSKLLFIISVTLGKIAMALIVYSLGSTGKWIIDIYISNIGALTVTNIIVLGAIVILASILITYTIISVNWFRIYSAYAERGEGEAIKTLIDEIKIALTFKNIRNKAVLASK
ncbi:MAG: hypothetical protein QXO93_00065 [Acidilobaceae archaeon]